MKPKFSSTIGPVIHRFVILKQSLGLNYTEQTKILLSLDRFLTDTSNIYHDLTAEAYLAWCQSFSRLSNSTRRMWMQTARDLCRYRRRCEPTCFVPDDATFPGRQQPIQPYIFSAVEIERMLDQSRHLTRHTYSPLRPELFRLVIVLLFTTGLRHRELLRLKVGDYDPGEGTLLIRDSKFHKSRILPLPKDVSREVDCYLAARRQRHLPVTVETPLVWNCSNGDRTYSSHGLWRNVRLLLKKAGIQKPNGQLPRLHDFRHSFAVNALLRWYRAGIDVQTKLPFLAAYLGHLNIASTYYYLHFVEPLASVASARFANQYGALVNPRAQSKKGGE
ncbi:MAG: tyrosine-type recombinase/integrase [Blastocatellia bacterium]